MKLRLLFGVLYILSLAGTPTWAQPTIKCLQNLTISVEGQGDEIVTCTGEESASELKFRPNTFATPIYYLVTDAENIILKATQNPTINFDELGIGNYRVWALSYVGLPLVEEGLDADTAKLGTTCSELSQNFIQVSHINPEGGTVSTSQGLTERFTCLGDGEADIIEFQTTSDDPFYTYIITDENNIILDSAPDGSYDFENSEPGICRVWGLSYIGNLALETGQPLMGSQLTDRCFDLSDNFIQVQKVTPDGGILMTEAGQETTVACTGDGMSDVITFLAQTQSQAPYVFLRTDENNIIQEVLTGNSRDFEDLPTGVCRIWGLSYIGNLNAPVGADAAAIALSDDCYDLSGNFIRIDKKNPEGGKLSLSGGGTETRLCVSDGVPDALSVLTDATENENYVFAVTDENDEIIEIDEDGDFDFEGSQGGPVRIWGIAYSGNLLAGAGDLLGADALSDECWETSSNFISIMRVALDGGTVTTADGMTETTVCLGDNETGSRSFIAEATGAMGEFIFVLTDANNLIIDLSADGTFDFTAATPGSCRVWGLNYTGTLTAQPGDDAAAISLSDECFDLSDNFVAVNRRQVDGGTVSLAGGGNEGTACVQDGVPDLFEFQNTSQAAESGYTYAVTDENNNLQVIINGGNIDFDVLAPGTSRVYGLSYTGNLTSAINADITTVPLSDECFELSDNFLTINRVRVDGGTVTLADGATEASICQGEAGNAPLQFVSTDAGAAGQFVFVITDNNNRILQTSADGLVDFTALPGDPLLVWGLNYTGNLTAASGEDASAIPLSDECYDLSDNFVTITRQGVDGGIVALEGGATTATACVRDGIPDMFEFQFATEAPEASYTFAITDDNNVLQVILQNGSIDLDVLSPGVTRIYGISYTGNLTNRINIDITAASLSDECYDLSDNFITINREEVTGGSISLQDGGTETRTCPGDGNSDQVSVVSNGSSTGSYIYLVTDSANVIFDIVQNPVYDFEGAPEDIYRIWGLAFTGALTIGTGDDVDEATLSNQCAELSADFVRVLHQAPVAGTVALEDGTTERLNCPTASEAPVVSFDSSGVTSPAYTYLITDELNIIQAIPGADRFNFGELPNGVYRIWGLAYSGNLLAAVGDDAGSDVLSDNCSALSSNFILIVNEEPEAGTVMTEAGSNLVYTCAADGNPNVVRFDSTGTIGNYRYLLTNSANIIEAILEADAFDFENLSEGTSRVWGLAFTGNLTTQVGDDAATTSLSDDCFDLSDNFIEVIRTVPEGGELSSDSQDLSFCAGDGNPDLVDFAGSGASPAPYALLVTNDNNQLITFSLSGAVDFDTTGGGPARVWGLSYTGSLQLDAGADILSASLSDDCFDLSDNFIPVDRTGVDGGRISSDLGDGTVYVCRGDGVEDLLVFSNTGTADNAIYRYVITNEENRVLRVLEGNEQNFEDLGLARLRVWGLSYTGDLLAGTGRDLDEDPISDGCFTRSENFITVVLDQPEGGTVQSVAGETDITLCIGQGDPVISFEAATGSQSGYQFVLTDDNNLIRQLPEDNMVDFGSLENGFYRLWGLSYTGLLVAEEGMDAAGGEPLASSCFELSENFVTIRKGGPVDGGQVTAYGSDTYQSCPADGIPDIISLETTSTAAGISNYRYVITDTTDRILFPDIEGSVFDFDGAPPGVYRIFGVSYTGNFIANRGDDVRTAALSDICYEASGSFVKVIYRNPEAGSISTTDGLTGPLTTLACGGEIADEIGFSREDSDAESYAYLISEDGIIIETIAEGETFDFSTLPCGLTYTVRGLAFEGELPDLSGLPLADLPFLGVIEGCFALSENVIEIVQGSGLADGNDTPGISGNTGETAHNPVASLHLAPNPVREQLQVRFAVDEPQQLTSELLILGADGRLVKRLEVPTYRGENTVTVPVQALPAGMYFMHVRHGKHFKYDRFVVTN